MRQSPYPRTTPANLGAGKQEAPRKPRGHGEAAEVGKDRHLIEEDKTKKAILFKQKTPTEKAPQNRNSRKRERKENRKPARKINAGKNQRVRKKSTHEKNEKKKHQPKTRKKRKRRPPMGELLDEGVEIADFQGNDVRADHTPPRGKERSDFRGGMNPGKALLKTRRKRKKDGLGKGFNRNREKGTSAKRGRKRKPGELDRLVLRRKQKKKEK